MGNTKYKKKDLIESLRRLYIKKGNKTPRVVDTFYDKEVPSYATYVNHFGSWKNALKAARLDKD